MLIHNADITGSLLVNGTGYNTGSFSGSFTGIVAGTTATASYVEYNSVANKPALVSGSSQITYSGLTGIPSGIVSGSSQVSFNGIVDKPTLVSGSEQISFNGIVDKPTLVSGSSQITYSGLSGIPAGIVSGSSQVAALGFATTGSNTFQGSQIVTGSLFITQNLIVAGSSSIQYISSSVLDIADNIITVNAFNPGVRFGGLAVIDSGSSPQVSGSLLFDSIKDQWIFVHQNQSVVTSSVVLMGPETYNDLGNESYISANRLPKGSGVEHLRDSNISDTGTVVSINSNTQVTGSLNVSSTGVFSSNVTSTQYTATSTGGSGLRVYGASGTNQWDIYLNSTNLRFSDNTGTGSIVFDRPISGTTASFKVNADRNLAIKYDTNITISGQADSGGPESLRIYADTFRIYTSTTAVGLTERFTISNTGNIGIGAPSPGNLLALEKSSNSGSGSTFPRIKVMNTLATQGDGTSTFNFADIMISAGNEAVNMFLATTYAAGTWAPAGIINVSTNHDLQFKTNNTTRLTLANSGAATFSSSVTATRGFFSSNAASDSTTALLANASTNDSSTYAALFGSLNAGYRMVVRADGNVGIGINSPTTKLHVVGESRFGTATNYVSTFADGSGVYFENTGTTTSTRQIRIQGINDAGNAYTQFFINHGASNFQFNVNDQVRIRIDGDGLKFNADTAAANALDDYEEGTWTPGFSGAGSPSYSVQFGTYTKIGNFVYCTIALRATSISGGDTINITGLPFAAAGVGDSGQRSTYSPRLGGHILGLSETTSKFRVTGGSTLQGVYGDGQTLFLPASTFCASGTINLTGNFSFYV